jgi:cobalt-zinc-cadmium efflux system outer membrane protein
MLFTLAAGPAHAAGPTGDLTLRDALAAALRDSPALAADAAEVRAREAEMLQAGRRPNPELGVELENLAGSGPFSGLDGLETTLALSQAIELGGKRGRRVEAARLDRDVAAWDA